MYGCVVRTYHVVHENHLGSFVVPLVGGIEREARGSGLDPQVPPLLVVTRARVVLHTYTVIIVCSGSLMCEVQHIYVIMHTQTHTQHVNTHMCTCTSSNHARSQTKIGRAIATDSISTNHSTQQQFNAQPGTKEF